jgi:hypothetical protein
MMMRQIHREKLVGERFGEYIGVREVRATGMISFAYLKVIEQ